MNLYDDAEIRDAESPARIPQQLDSEDLTFDAWLASFITLQALEDANGIDAVA